MQIHLAILGVLFSASVAVGQDLRGFHDPDPGVPRVRPQAPRITELTYVGIFPEWPKWRIDFEWSDHPSNPEWCLTLPYWTVDRDGEYAYTTDRNEHRAVDPGETSETTAHQRDPETGLRVFGLYDPGAQWFQNGEQLYVFMTARSSSSGGCVNDVSDVSNVVPLPRSGSAIIQTPVPALPFLNRALDWLLGGR